MTPAVTLITPTCDQPVGLALCEQFMARQTWPVAQAQWIVVDDGETPARLTMGQTHVRRARPHDCPGYQSLAHNLQAALPLAQGDIIVVIEHDDYYAPEHLETVLSALMAPHALIAGDTVQRYYHVGRRCWRQLQNQGAALCQTAFRRELLPAFDATIRECLGRRSFGIDAAFWRRVPPDRWAVTGHTVVGIKGLPGRPGLGMGHRPDGRWTADPALVQLRAWIGCEADADLYLPFGHRSEAA